MATAKDEDTESYKQRSTLYRFRAGEWKLGGLGEARLLQHKVTRHVGFQLRQEKAGKIVANHPVVGGGYYCDLRPNNGNGKCWVWAAEDHSEEEVLTEHFALRFGALELARAVQAGLRRGEDNKCSVLIPSFNPAMYVGIQSLLMHLAAHILVLKCIWPHTSWSPGAELVRVRGVGCCCVVCCCFCCCLLCVASVVVLVAGCWF